jgi:hypothetical protein
MNEKKIFDLYQTNGLLETIGGNDGIYDSLQKAIDELTNKLTAERNIINLYTLVTLDKGVSEDERVYV